MPLSGEYEPSTQEWVRNQVDLYERTNGQQGGTLSDTGLPVIILWTLGAQQDSKPLKCTVRNCKLLDNDIAIV